MNTHTRSHLYTWDEYFLLFSSFRMYRINSTVFSDSFIRTAQFRRMFTIDLVKITIIERLTDISCTSPSSNSSSIEKRLHFFAVYDEQFFFVFAWQFVVVINSPSSQFNDLLFFFAFFLCKMTCRTRRRLCTTRSYVHCL